MTDPNQATPSLATAMIEQGDNFSLDSIPEFNERNEAGEFEGMTDEQIRDKFLDEVIQDEEHEAERNSIQRTIDDEDAVDPT